MTAEFPQPSAPETHDIQTPDGFLRELLGRTRQMIETEKDAKVVAEVGETFIQRWDSFSPYPPSVVPLPIKIEKALILRSERHDYGLVLGQRGFTNYDQERLTLEFGLVPHRENMDFDQTLDQHNVFKKQITREENILSYLSLIVHQTLMTWGSGSFSSERGTVEVDCWVDGYSYGGAGVGRWPYGEILSERGLNASVDIVRELTKRKARG